MATWVDASTLIALDLAGEVALLRDILGRVRITREVASEVFTGRESLNLREARATWIAIVPVRGDLRRWQRLGLGKGEASLFLTPGDDRLVLDDAPARTVAEAEGRDYVGLLGLLLSAVDAGRISRGRAKAVVQSIVRHGFYVSAALYDEVLRGFEESP